MITKQISQERIEEVIKSGEKQMLDDLKFLHSQGQSLEQILPNKSTYLHIACANGYYDVAAFLLRVGVSVSSFDGDFWMPIHIAAFFDYPRLIELLVSYKADINQKTKSEETAYDLCGRLETRQLISKIERKDVKKKRSAYGVRDSRRQARKTKVEAIKNFEADEVGARTSVRRSSFREKNGEAMAKFDAKRENLALRDGKMDSSDGYQSEDIENEEMPTFKDKYDAKKQVLNQNERSTLLVQLNPSSQKLEEVDVKLTKDADDISKKNSFSKKIRSSIRKLRKQTSDEDIKKLSLKENGLVTGDDHNKRNSCCAIC
uniref:ANK_REP_REGION domain-containing protein n=1 Tax=Rhabditophanes sp. KR3021 TaxID=114890 RepID=A0AC35TQG9_9BILA